MLHALAPPRTGKSGRPRTKGDLLGTPADLARTAVWRTAQVRRYRRTDTVEIAETICLWYGSFHTRTVRVVLVRDSKPRTRDRDDRGYGLPLVTTDLTSTPENLVARYAARWCIEVAFFDAHQTLGVGQARNRTRLAVERTVPFRPDLPEPGHHLVRHRRPLARRYRRTPVTGPLVHHQDRTVLRRHDEQAAPRHHRRQISALTPPTRQHPKKPKPSSQPGPPPKHDQPEPRNTRARGGRDRVARGWVRPHLPTKERSAQITRIRRCAFTKPGQRLRYG
ncbi:hypothetical protein ACWCQN_15830 [Streptomyces sp. NPDC001984]